MKPTLALIGVFALSVQTAHSQLLISHQGATAPQLEGWNRAASGFPQPIGAAVFDGSIAAWEVNKTVVNSSLSYSYTISAPDLLVAKQRGWSFSFNLLVAEYPAGPDNSITFQVDTNGEVWNARLGAAANGDPIFQFGFGSYAPVNVALGGGLYHEYNLVYDPLKGNLNLYIDNLLRLQDVEGGSSANSLGTGSVSWGAGSFSGTGDGHWNSVEFAIQPVAVPEPASLGIFGGLVLMIFCRFRKKMSDRK